MTRAIESVVSAWMCNDYLKPWKHDPVEIHNDSLMCYAYSQSVPIAKKMRTETFFALNTDALYDPGFSSNTIGRVVRCMGSCMVPLSFRAAQAANIELSDTNVYYNRVNNGHYYEVGNRAIAKTIVSYMDRYFITLSDKFWRGLVEIKNPMCSWDDSVDCLKPKAVRAWEKETGFMSRRQGEWYLIPRPKMKIPKADIQSKVFLPHGTHLANKYAKIDGKTYIRGTLRHRPGENKRSSWYRYFARPWERMGKYWHEVHMANFIEAYK